MAAETEPMRARIARLIRADIEAGRLRDGEALPSTRVLAERWGTSAFTVSQAMETLADEGLIESQSRSKRIVRAPGCVVQTRPTEPVVVFVGGYAGSGKTEFGRCLARSTGWPVLDKDTTTRPVVEALLEQLGQPPHDRESEPYLTVVRPREYEALLGTVIENVECGVSVIATAPFVAELRDPAWMARTRDRIEAAGASLTTVWLRCDVPSMHAYIRHRGAARDAGKLARWEQYAAGLDLGYTPVGPHVIVKNGEQAEPLRAQVARLIQSLAPAQTEQRM